MRRSANAGAHPGARPVRREQVRSTGSVEELLAERDDGLDPQARRLLDQWLSACSQLPWRRAGGAGARPRDPHPPHPHHPLRFDRAQGGPAARTRRPRRCSAFLRENLPGLFPFTAGVFPSSGKRGSDPHTSRRGRPLPHQPPLQDGERGHARAPAVHRLRLAHPVRLRPGRTAGHLRQDRQLGRVHRHPGRHAECSTTADLCAPTTSVSMTINGPAPIILAMFFNTALDQQLDRFVAEHGRPATEAEALEIRRQTFSTVRGIQADILKEDQGQEHLHLLHRVRPQDDGRHPGVFRPRAGAQLLRCPSPATTSPRPGPTRSRNWPLRLANGFTYVEAYLARGMHIDEFAPNLSFFQRHGRVLGDRPGGPRIWAGMKHVRCQRALAEAQVPHPDPAGPCTPRRWLSTTSAPPCRPSSPSTTTATRCTPTPLTRPSPPPPRSLCAAPWPSSWSSTGEVAKNENPNQGSFLIDELTDLEEAVLQEFEALPRAAACSGPWRPATSAAASRRSRSTTNAQEARRLLPHHRREHLQNPEGDVTAA